MSELWRWLILVLAGAGALVVALLLYVYWVEYHREDEPGSGGD